MNSTGSEAALILDERRFRENFDREAFRIGHRLADEPLFSLESLAALASRLPAASVEYNSADIPVGMAARRAPGNGLSIAETIQQIRQCRSWMVLKHVERDPAYRAILDRCLDQVRPLSEPIAPGMARREAFVFVSSPGAITPFHVDPEYNFLLQIQGSKSMTVWRPDDMLAAGDPELEATLAGSSRNLRYRQEFEAGATCFHLAPGEGLHVPLWAPHWVEVGDSVSVSLSITFRASPSERRLGVMRMNRGLRRLGLHPAPYGTRPLADALKYTTFRAGRRIASLLGAAA